MGGEECFDLIEVRIVGDGSAAVGLDVNLVDLDLAGEIIPGFLKIGRILHLLHDEDGDVNGDAKLVMFWRGSGNKRARESRRER